MWRVRAWVIAVNATLAVLGVGAAATSSGPMAQADPPSITWTPPNVDLVIPPEAVFPVRVSFTSHEEIKNAIIGAAPEIASFLSFRTSTIPTVPASKPKQIEISFAFPSGTKEGTYKGTVHIESGGRTVSQTLKVSLAVMARGVALSVPEGYEVSSELIPLGGSISIDDNFDTSIFTAALIRPAVPRLPSRA